MTTILEDRLARLMSDEVHLRKGQGKGANGTVDVCAVQAADWRADRIFWRLPFHQKCLLLDDARYWIQAYELTNMAQEARKEERKWLSQSRKLLLEVRKWLQGGQNRAASKLQAEGSLPDETLQAL